MKNGEIFMKIPEKLDMECKGCAFGNYEHCEFASTCYDTIYKKVPSADLLRCIIKRGKISKRESAPTQTYINIGKDGKNSRHNIFITIKDDLFDEVVNKESILHDSI